MKKILLTSIIISILSGQSGFESKVGTTAATFLVIPVGARAMGLAEAFVANVDDETAMFWNPAGMVQQENGSGFFFSTLDWFMDLNLGSAGMTCKTGKKSIIGIGINALDLGQIDVTTIRQPEGNENTVDANELALSLSYARYLTHAFSLGVTGKWIVSSYANETASGFAIDIGTLYNTGWRGLRVGMSLTNFGTKLKLEGRDLIISHDQDILLGSDQPVDGRLHTEGWNMPTSFRLGVAMEIFQNKVLRWIVSADGVHATDVNERAMFGSEIKIGNFSLRTGFGIGYDQQRLAAGGGFNKDLAGFTLGIDYGMMTVEPFGLVHSVTARIIP